MEFTVKFFAENLHPEFAVIVEAVCWIAEEPTTVADVEVLELYNAKTDDKVQLSSLGPDDMASMMAAISSQLTNMYNQWQSTEPRSRHDYD